MGPNFRTYNDCFRGERNSGIWCNLDSGQRRRCFFGGVDVESGILPSSRGWAPSIEQSDPLLPEIARVSCLPCRHLKLCEQERRGLCPRLGSSKASGESVGLLLKLLPEFLDAGAHALGDNLKGFGLRFRRHLGKFAHVA